MGIMDLFRPKWKHSNPTVREAAVERLKDQELFAEIAKNDEDSVLRWTAVERLEDQELLAEIAKNDKDSDVRWTAVKKLEDQELLAKLADNYEDEYICRAARERLLEQLFSEKSMPPREEGFKIESNFIDNGNGTVTDQNHSLMWQQEDDGKERSLNEAFAQCEELSLAGFRDWRLPTLDETQALEDAKRRENKIPIRHSQNVCDYWTSTTPSPFSGLPETVAYAASGNTYFKTNRYNVRCVRDC